MIYKNPRTASTLFILFAFSFLTRFLLISKGPYHLDCLVLAINARETLVTQQLHYQFGFGYPLTVIMGSLFAGLMQLFSVDDPVSSVNLMSVVVSSLTVPLFYLLVRNISNNTAALFSALALSLHPIFLTLSVYGNSHVTSLFFLIASLYFLTRPAPHLVLSSLLFGCMGAARLQDMVLMLIPVILLLIYKKESVWTVLKYSITAAVTAALCHVPYFLSNANSHYIDQLRSFFQVGVTANHAGLFSPNLCFSLETIFYATAYVNVFIALFGVYLLIRNKKYALVLFLTSWLLVPLLFYGNLQTVAPRFFLISLPPLLIGLGYGMNYFLDLSSRLFKMALAIVFCFTLLVPLITSIFPILAFRHSMALLPEWAEFIGDNTEPHALIITGDDQDFITHYGKRTVFYRHKDFFHLDPVEFEKFKQKLTSLLDENVPVYITRDGLYSYDPARKFSSYILENYRLEFQGTRKYEDWHGGELILKVQREALYRIYKK